MPYNAQIATDRYYVRALEQKEKIVPDLIQRIDDKTIVPLEGTVVGSGYGVGDVCLHVLSALYKDFKPLNLLESIDFLDVGYRAYMSGGEENRERFKKTVEGWFERNKDKFTWVVDTKLYRIAEDEFDNRKRRNPIGGYYIIKK